MRKIITLSILIIAGIACSRNASQGNVASNDHIGTWMLVSKTTTIRDSVGHTSLAGKKIIKIITPKHFAFFTHEVKNEKDSTNTPAPEFEAGEGSYTLNDRIYTEFLEYCNYREWENHSFTFDLEIKGDSLIQSGVEELKDLGINQVIVEKYIRVKD